MTHYKFTSHRVFQPCLRTWRLFDACALASSSSRACTEAILRTCCNNVVLFLPRPLSYDFSQLLSHTIFSSRINEHVLMPAHTIVRYQYTCTHQLHEMNNKLACENINCGHTCLYVRFCLTARVHIHDSILNLCTLLRLSFCTQNVVACNPL